MSALDPSVDWRTDMRSVEQRITPHRYSTWNRKKTTLFSGHYLRNRSTLDIGVLGYIGVLWLQEHSPEVWHTPPGNVSKHIWTKIYLIFRKKLSLLLQCVHKEQRATDFEIKLQII